jgi:hypothetical protein
MLNRGALIVRPAGPFIKWASGLDDSGVLPENDGEKTVYLVPVFEDSAEAERVLRRVFSEVFERELFGWHTDEAAWPQRRTLAMFKKWFNIELHSVVEDLCSYEVSDDEL